MSRQKLKAERRLYPRINTELPLRVIANGYDLSTTTQNLSCLGAYCRIKRYIPPFTKLHIKLNLPMVAAKTKEKFSTLECKGVVVRTEDVDDGGFNIAIFFNGIEDTQRHKISQYLKQFVTTIDSPEAASLAR